MLVLKKKKKNSVIILILKYSIEYSQYLVQYSNTFSVLIIQNNHFYFLNYREKKFGGGFCLTLKKDQGDDVPHRKKWKGFFPFTVSRSLKYQVDNFNFN